MLILMVVSGVLILGGVVLIVLGIALAKATFFKVMFIIISVLMILLGCVMLYFVFMVKEHDRGSEEPNLFLYNPETDENMSSEVLSFELVDKRMTFFMSRIARNIREVWSTNLFDNEEVFDGVDELKTLLAYKMLYDLADKDVPALWELYLRADGGLIKAISENIESNGDPLANHLSRLHGEAVAKSSVERSRKFLTDNKTYIRNKMFACAKNNIEKF